MEHILKIEKKAKPLKKDQRLCLNLFLSVCFEAKQKNY